MLYLLNANITDAGLEHLATLRQVQVLHIGGTKITDAGLQHLLNLKCLRHLVLYNTTITDQGCAALQRSIPECYIAR